MAVNKVIYDGATLVDLTGDTVTADNLAAGVKATGADGKPVVGLLPMVTVDAELSDASENPVQNKVINAAFSGLGAKMKYGFQSISESIPVKLTDLENDADYVTNDTLLTKMNALAKVATSGNYDDLINKPHKVSHIMMGQIVQGGVIPIPQGVNRENCYYAVWISDLSQELKNVTRIVCKVNQGSGRVICRATIEDAEGNVTDYNPTVNYLCIVYE
ncbi:hypothetical protein [Phascolarctobacterium succinatutens]|uniref:hypothetical protein n=1 Tax=Phascolarctobacterium succinatutens TaxID=626940 RepID=UPI0026EAEF58|nr:hypothetical protein [Phascolarctobacterium succinatutens]